MKCKCCENRLYGARECFGAPDAPLCILCWLNGREKSWMFGGPTTFGWNEESRVYAEVMKTAQLPLLEIPERMAA